MNEYKATGGCLNDNVTPVTYEHMYHTFMCINGTIEPNESNRHASFFGANRRGGHKKDNINTQKKFVLYPCKERVLNY